MHKAKTLWKDVVLDRVANISGNVELCCILSCHVAQLKVISSLYHTQSSGQVSFPALLDVCKVLFKPHTFPELVHWMTLKALQASYSGGSVCHLSNLCRKHVFTCKEEESSQANRSVMHCPKICVGLSVLLNAHGCVDIDTYEVSS